MATISEALAIALQHHHAGRLAAAAQVYRQILAVEPNHVDATHLLGLIAHQAGQHSVAAEYVERAIALDSGVAAFHNNLGEIFRALRRLPEAVACYRRALERKPDYAEAYNNLGNGLRDEGKLPEAAACCRRALELRPDYAEAHNNLGNALSDQGKAAEALACYRRALELKPDYAEAHNNLGAAFNDLGKLDEAIACYRRALELEPDDAEACNNLGVALKDQGKQAEALACYRRALELKPGFAEACYNLGRTLYDQAKLDEAVACYRRALELKPDFAGAHRHLAMALWDRGEVDAAAASFRRALELTPGSAEAHSNLLSTLQYCAGITPAALAEAHAEYDRCHAAPLRGATVQHEYPRDGRTRPNHDPRLRLGFVSPDLGRHPVGCFLVCVLEHLSRQQAETVCYSDRAINDDIAHRLRAAATEWREAAGVSDDTLAEQIRSDRIDILFDLAGHTAHNRLLVFARKPAPIQVTWAGYVGTTGLREMDYLLADRYEVPPGAERHYRERILRMPDGYVCYDPPAHAPPVAPLPALDCGRVTFGCFNNPAKVTPQVIEVWAKILRRLPGAQLRLKCFKPTDKGGAARRFADVFSAPAIDPARLEIFGFSPHAELLAEYHGIDIALDPFPYNGGLTTCEALWMGVPVVTCPGETFASRHSLSHLSNVGLTETIARDLHEYVEIAVALANDLPRLADIRARLRQQMAASPLCDGPRFAANLMALLGDVWRRWCEGKDGG